MSLLYKHGHLIRDCPTHPLWIGETTKVGGSPSSKEAFSVPSSSAVVVAFVDSTSLSLSDLVPLLKQGLSFSSSSHSVLSVTQGNSIWLFYSACYNHMTPNLQNFYTHVSTSSLPPIHIANDAKMLIIHVGHASTSNLSLSDTYCVPTLGFNLISIRQLCDLGLKIIFSSSGCQVQDLTTRVILGTSRKVGRFFELVTLHT